MIQLTEPELRLLLERPTDCYAPALKGKLDAELRRLGGEDAGEQARR